MLVLKGHRGRVRSLSFSADGGLLASCAGHGKAVWLWDLNRQGKRGFLSGHRSRVTAVAFAPAGEWLASRDAWGFTLLWDVPRRRELAHALGPLPSMFGHAVTPDGRRLVVGQNDGRSFPQQSYEVRHLDVAAGVEVPEVRVHSGAGRTAGVGLAYSPAGDALAVVTLGGQVHLWGLSPVRRRGQVPYRRALNALAFAPDGRTLAVAAGLEVRLWDTATGAERATLRGHARVVTGVAFTPDGRLLASASTDGQVKLWDVAAAKERAAYDWQVGPVTALALAPDGMRGACGGARGALAVWDLDL
jgi:WD40 repeat protein